MAEAAYNLGVLISDDRASEAVNLIRKAFELRPNPGYAYTLAFYMRRNEDLNLAVETLRLMTKQWPAYGDAYLLLGDIYEEQDKKEEAESVYREGLAQERLSRQDRYRIETKLKTLETSQGNNKEQN
jgi:predicted Zn-dependent protease